MATNKYLNLEGLREFLRKTDERYASIQALVYKGVKANIAALPTVADEAIGNMYTVTEGGETTSDFVEGAGKTLQDGENVVAVNTGTDADPIMKWDILGGVFDFTDRLQFGDTMPSTDLVDGRVFMYLGDTSYTYTAVTPVGDENPSELGWYVEDGSGGYELTSDTTVQSGTTYYTRAEEYVQGVIYEYDATGQKWDALSSGDVMVAITTQEIDALFA